MGRHVKDYYLGTREARSKLARRHNPYWREITPGLHIGYRKGKRGGSWIGRKLLDDGKHRKWKLATADDIVDSNGVDILNFTEADDKARLGPPDFAGHGNLEIVNDIMDYYMKQQRAESRSAVITQYAVDTHITPKLGSRKVSRLTVEAITDWRNDLAATPRKFPSKNKLTDSPREQKRKRQASANRVLTIFKAALNYAERTGKYQGPTPWKLVRPFRNVDATEHPYLSRDGAIRLQNACHPDFRQIVRGALETGCRYGELRSMKASDYNADAGTLVIRESKNGKIRHVHLTESGQDFFDELLLGKIKSELMFLKESGERWGTSQQGMRMIEACKIAKIDPPVPFKALRTTYGSLLATAGVPLQVISSALGHSDSRITEKHYAHLMPNYVADTIRANLPAFSTKKSKVRRIKQR